MAEKIVHPSEIIDKKKRKKAPSQKRIDALPWVRFLARMFDYAFIALIILLIRVFLFHRPYPIEFFLPLELIIWIPVEAFFLSLFGKTPGKALLNCHVEHRGKKPDFKKGLSRSFAVWLRGMGLGLYFISIIAMLLAYVKLQQFGKTTWDRIESTSVKHKSVHPIRFIIAALFIIFVIFLKRYY